MSEHSHDGAVTTEAIPQPTIGHSLTGHKALITGGGRGIGRAIALRFGQAGADVFLAARNEEELGSTAEAVELTGVRAFALQCDLTVDGAAEQLVENAASALGGLSLVVNNAGGAHRIVELASLDERTFALGTTLNYTAVYRVMHAAAPHLFAAAPRAAVLNIVSIAAARGLPGLSYYSGAKAAVVATSRAAAREWGPRGVRVNCLGPGWIATDLNRELRADPVWSDRTLEEIALGRWGTPDDVADVALFLMSDAARYVTGATLYVDGGLLA